MKKETMQWWIVSVISGNIATMIIVLLVNSFGMNNASKSFGGTSSIV